MSVQVERRVELHRQHIHDSLVGRHHDGRVGNLADELRGQAAVQSRLALLLPHQEQRLPETVVLVALLAQSRSRHLMRVRDARRDGLRRRPGQHELYEVAGGSALVRVLLTQLKLRKKRNLTNVLMEFKSSPLTSFFLSAS